MPIIHTTRRGKRYFLHTGPKKGGGTQFFFSTDPDGPLAEEIPAGFEVYETVNGQAYLRRKNHGWFSKRKRLTSETRWPSEAVRRTTQWRCVAMS